MAHLALYRAFRPKSLDEVVRQEHIVTVLKNQIETNRIGHAYLFCGPRGTGKTSVAKIFATAINCERPVGGSPCGQCEVCKSLADPSNLDITEIDAASNNGVDEMRDLREKVQYPPVSGRYKVYIIDEVHMLSMQAFNALLKTLEEPPAHAVFVLATTESQKIPATILSRCMRFDFKLIPQEDLESRLRFVLDSIGKKYDGEAVAAIARAGAGSARDMLSLADTCVSFSEGKLTYKDVMAVLGSADFDAVRMLCSAFLKGNAGDAFERAESFLAEGKSVGMLVSDTLQFLNSLAIAKTCKGAKKLLALPDDLFESVAALAKETDGGTILRATEIFARAEMDLKYSTSPRVVFETAVFKAAMPQTECDLDGLLARVAALEEKLASGMAVAPTVLPVEQARTVEKTPVYEEPPMEEPPEEEYATPPKKAVAEKLPVIEEKPMKKAPAGDAKGTFGSFLRALRKTGRNGVLFTICMDLDSVYDGDTFVLSTASESMFASLTKAEHYALIRQAFDAIGIAESGFDIRLQGKQADTFDKSFQELKATFPDVKIEIK